MHWVLTTVIMLTPHTELNGQWPGEAERLARAYWSRVTKTQNTSHFLPFFSSLRTKDPIIPSSTALGPLLFPHHTERAELTLSICSQGKRGPFGHLGDLRIMCIFKASISL
jgi:hypothetical protein